MEPDDLLFYDERLASITDLEELKVYHNSFFGEYYIAFIKDNLQFQEGRDVHEYELEFYKKLKRNWEHTKKLKTINSLKGIRA